MKSSAEGLIEQKQIIRDEGQGPSIDKVEGLLGFAIKSGKIIYGLDRIEAARRKYLIVMDNTAGKNTTKSIYYVAEKENVPLVLSSRPLEDVVHKKNCKAVAVTDKNLAKGIIAKLGNNYLEVNKGVREAD